MEASSDYTMAADLGMLDETAGVPHTVADASAAAGVAVLALTLASRGKNPDESVEHIDAGAGPVQAQVIHYAKNAAEHAAGIAPDTATVQGNRRRYGAAHWSLTHAWHSLGYCRED